MLTSATGISSKSGFAGPGNRTSPYNPRQHGFSLLELLVVVIIVAVLFSFTTLAIRGTTPEELLQTEAQRLDRLLQLALEDAILRGMEFGIEFKPDGYRFMFYAENAWQSLEADRLLHERQLPEDMEFELEIEQIDVVIEDEKDTDEDDKDEDRLQPQVFILSSGEITPEFSVRLVMSGVAASYIVSATANGEHKAERSEL